MGIARRSKKSQELGDLLKKWRELKAQCDEMSDKASSLGGLDLEEACCLLEDRKDIADRAVAEFLRQMDKGHVVVPDVEVMLEVLKEARAEGRCCE